MSDIKAVLTAIAVLENAIATPAGATALKQRTNPEPPLEIGLWPAFANYPRGLTYTREPNAMRSFGNKRREQEYTIDCRLVFAPFDAKYQLLQQYLWTDPVTDAFDLDPHLGSTCDTSQIIGVDFAPWELGGKRFICSNFVLHLVMKGT